MPHSAMESIRQRLESTRRRQNVSLALLQLGRWLLACSLLFAFIAAIGSFFDSSAAVWKGIFLFWVASVFGISSFLIWRYLVQWQDGRHFVHRVEQQLPDLEQRLITSLEFENRNSPGVSPQFIDKLYEDARSRVEDRPLTSVVSFAAAYRALGLAGLSVASVLFLLLVSDPFLQAGRQIAWPWSGSPATVAPEALPVALHVEPGDVSMQRGDDMTVVASLDNAGSDQLTLYIQNDHLNWQKRAMAPDSGEPDGNAKVFSADVRQLTQDLVYYVEYRRGADVVRSPQYRVSLFDLPRLDELELAYDYPDYTGMENRVDNPGGDVVAPQGTRIDLSARLNKPVEAARLVFDDGESLPLTVDGERASGSFQVNSDGGYRIELTDANDFRNKNPRDYYIRAIQDREPEITLRAPGKDQRVMPLEEVTIEVNARDDYGLTEFELSYSVVGVGQKKVDFLQQGEQGKRTQITGSTLVYLEELEVQPGDIVSYSVTARDNNDLSGPTQVVSDIYFLEVIPTDHEFSRARGGGGGGGAGAGGGDASALVSNQKDVIAATWKLRNRKDKVDEDSFAEDGQIIRDSQAEVAQRAQMSINRLTERGRFADDNYQNALVALRRAIKEMEDAVTSLDELALPTALESEQRALRSILQAESQVNKTEVALNRSRGGSGGGQQRERQDLRELFEMEMGELENRYELPQQQSGQQRQAQNETLDKLKELARRQERLTRSQRELARRQNQMDEEQKRRQLEQLRREQEELRRQLAQLSQSMQQQSEQTQSSQSQPSRSGGQGGNRQQEQPQRQRMEEMQQALEQMQQAAQSESPSQAAAKGQKALDSLRRQTDQMDASAQQSVADLQQAVKERSRELVQQQRELRQMVEEKSREESLGNTRNQTARSGQTDELLQRQSDIRQGLDKLGRDLREIATRAGDDQQREMQEAHDLSRDLRPIQEKMSTSKQILERGMLNLSLNIESDIESALADLQRRIQGMGNAPGGPGSDQQSEQVARQVRELRESLQKLQQQIGERSGQQERPDRLAMRQGERSGAGRQERLEQDGQGVPGNRRQMEESLQRSRELAQGLAQLGLGGQAWSGSARSIRSQLTRQGLEEFLSRPELLEELLGPVIALENQLRVQAELNEIDNKLYSALEEEIPEQYKSLVESYYRVLSESKSSNAR